MAGFWEDTEENVPERDEATHLYLHRLEQSWAEMFKNRSLGELR
jgi:hypothetical protein